jgi:integrase
MKRRTVTETPDVRVIPTDTATPDRKVADIVADMTNAPTHRDDLEAVARTYLDGLRGRHLSTTTIDWHRGTLRRTTRWFGGPLLYRTSEDLERWQVDRAAKVAPNTLHGEMCVHRGFYRWAHQRGLIDVDPTANLQMPRLRKHLPRPMSDAKWQLAMDSADAVMAVILGLAGWAGLRACEIARLDWSDVDLIDRTLRVTGKGDQEGAPPIPRDLVEVMVRLPARTGPVIPRRDRRPGPNRPHTISHHANAYLHSLGIRDTLHALRHTFGSNILDAAGGNLRVAQEALRHQAVTSTAVYTRVRQPDVRAAVEGAADLLPRVRELRPRDGAA